MAAAVTNPYKLTWGSFVCGDTQERLIVGVHRTSKTFEAWSVTIDIAIRGTSDATFAANCIEMESEFAKRRQLILLQCNGVTVHTFNPSDTVNTGLNSYARIDKVGTPGGDTDRSRIYTVTLGCELPATDTSGRRDSSLVVEYDPAQRRTVTISGVWTAVTTSNATAQYAAQIAAFTSSALSALLPAGTFELIQQRTDRDDQDKTLRFSRVYREVGHIVADSILSNTSVVEATLAFARSIDQPGDSGGGGVKRLETISARFECFLDKTVSTDLEALYQDTIKAYIVSQFEAAYAPTSYAIVREHPTRVPYSNQVSVEIDFLAAIDPTDVIESVCTARIVESSGKVLTGAWTGGIFDKYVDQGHATRRRFGIRAVRVLGTIKPKQRVGGSGGTVFGVGFFNQDADGNATGSALGTFQPGGAVPEGGLGDHGGGGQSGWILMDNDSAATPKWIGQPNGEQIAVTDLVETTVEEWVDAPGGGGGPDFGVSFSGGSN